MASSSAELLSKLGDHVVLKFEGCTNLIKVDMETTTIHDIKMKSLLGPKLKLYYHHQELEDPETKMKVDSKTKHNTQNS